MIPPVEEKALVQVAGEVQMSSAVGSQNRTDWEEINAYPI
jgi:hypothetical protein